MFLLPIDVQRTVIAKAAGALNESGGVSARAPRVRLGLTSPLSLQPPTSHKPPARDQRPRETRRAPHPTASGTSRPAPRSNERSRPETDIGARHEPAAAAHDIDGRRLRERVVVAQVRRLRSAGAQRDPAAARHVDAAVECHAQRIGRADGLRHLAVDENLERCRSARSTRRRRTTRSDEGASRGKGDLVARPAAIHLEAHAAGRSRRTSGHA